METLKKNSTRIAQILGSLIALFLIVSILGGYWFGWAWTGLWHYVAPPVPEGQEFQRQKTLWDWMGLLIIPVVLATIAFLFNRAERANERAIAKAERDNERVIADERAEREQILADERARTERELAERRARTERELAEKREQTEREIATDNLREAALQAYFDRMSELLLVNGLRQSRPGDEVRAVARARTLTVLRGLDNIRKGSLLRFLRESYLIHVGKPIIDLTGADLSCADLRGANLSEADLRKANLKGVDLRGANLYGADLFNTDFEESDLSGARFTMANVSLQQLRSASSLKSTIMPDDTIHD